MMDTNNDKSRTISMNVVEVDLFKGEAGDRKSENGQSTAQRILTSAVKNQVLDSLVTELPVLKLGFQWENTIAAKFGLLQIVRRIMRETCIGTMRVFLSTIAIATLTVLITISWFREELLFLSWFNIPAGFTIIFYTWLPLDWNLTTVCIKSFRFWINLILEIAYVGVIGDIVSIDLRWLLGFPAITAVLAIQVLDALPPSLQVVRFWISFSTITVHVAIYIGLILAIIPNIEYENYDLGNLHGFSHTEIVIGKVQIACQLLLIQIVLELRDIHHLIIYRDEKDYRYNTLYSSIRRDESINDMSLP